jgi:hypothetical protein
VEHHAEVLSGGRWPQQVPSWRDAVALVLLVAILTELSGFASFFGLSRSVTRWFV